MGPSTISSWANLIARTLIERGVDAEAFFRRAKVSYTELHDPNARYPVAAVQRLWALAEDVTCDPCFGLEVGRAWHPTSFHALGYAALAAATLREALSYLVRYCHVVSTGARLELIDRDGEAALRVESRLREHSLVVAPAPASVQAGLVAIMVLCSQARGHPVALRRVTLRQHEREARARLQTFFGCPVLFEAQEDALVFLRDEIDASLPTANTVLAQINAKALEDYLSRIESPHTTDRVRARLIRALPAGKVSEAGVARALNMSLRSMQRKLRQEGTSFRALVDDTRRHLARQHQSDATMSLAEVAYLLGFSEASSLSRARRRWERREAGRSEESAAH